MEMADQHQRISQRLFAVCFRICCIVLRIDMRGFFFVLVRIEAFSQTYNKGDSIGLI